MKNKTKTIMAFLTAMTMTAGAMSATPYVEGLYFATEINNKDYKEYISNFTVSKYEEKLIEMYRERLEGGGIPDDKLIHVYVGRGGPTLIFELAYPDNTREFVKGFFMSLISDTEITADIDEVNEFLSASGLQGKVGISPDRMQMGVDFEPDQNRLYDDVISTYFALDDKYGLKNNLVLYEDAGKKFNDEGTLNSAILKGDADLNGDVDLADLTTVAKYNLNNELYPLANETAFANADMNSDGEVNGVDTSALIEDQLGK